MRVKFFLSLLFISLFIATVAFGYPEDQLRKKLNDLASRVGGKTNVVLIDLRTSKVVYQRKAEEKVKPASVLKIITSGVALSLLGPDYRFRTEFLANSTMGKGGAIGAIDTLYVKGGGDPSFTIEDLLIMVRRLKRLGVKTIKNVVLDDTLFDVAHSRVGQKAYEAGASGLPFNFNTVSFEVCPTEAGRAALVMPDPSEVSVAITGQIKTIGKGRAGFSIDDAGAGSGTLSFRVSGSISQTSGCQTVYRSVSDPTRYFGASLSGLLKAHGIKVSSEPTKGKVSKGARNLTRHESKPLSQIVWDLNHYSTNFIAEQLLYHIGFSQAQSLSRVSGLARMGMYLEKLGFSDKHFDLYDGSGLSHQNRITAMILGRVLVDIYKNQRIWPEFESSLAIAGQSGTLRKRLRGLKGGIVRAKTGSLNGVTSLAGYINTDSGGRFAFVSITNGGVHFNQARRFEEDLIKVVVGNQ